MPIYEFICESCGNEFEQIRSFSESTMPECTKCGSAQVSRRMGRPAIHFKGSGWYINDSKKSSDKGGSKSASESSKSESTTESSTTSAGEGKIESKADSKTENKTESKSDSKADSKSESAPAPVASSD